MKRKNFLRQMAFTVPIGIAAPKMLFAGTDSKYPVSEKPILVVDDTATALPESCSAFRKINAAAVASMEFKNGCFLLTDKTGNRFSVQKLIFAGDVQLKNGMQHCGFAATPEVSVEFGESKRSAGFLSLNSYQLPQYHIQRKKSFEQENLQQFLSRKRAGVLQLV